MQLDLPLLSLVIWLPIIGGLWVIFAGSGRRERGVRVDALLISVARMRAARSVPPPAP